MGEIVNGWVSVFVILSCKIFFLNTDERHVVAPHKIFCGVALVSFFTVTVCYNYQTSETTIVQVRNCKQVIKSSGVWRPLSCVAWKWWWVGSQKTTNKGSISQIVKRLWTHHLLKTILELKSSQARTFSHYLLIKCPVRLRLFGPHLPIHLSTP